MKIKIKKLVPDSVIPKYAKESDAGLDLTAVDRYYDEDGNIVYRTGLAIEIPQGFVGYLFPRSSLSKYNLSLTNSVGVIDSGYRGEILFKFKPIEPGHNKTTKNDIYELGERVGQLIVMPIPTVEFEEVAELSDSERGTGGFGSTN